MSDWDSGDDEDEYSEDDDDAYAGNWYGEDDDDFDYLHGENYGDYCRRRQEAAEELARERCEDRLMRACEAGDAAAVARCLEFLEFPRHEIIDVATFPIRVASELGHVDVVRALLDRGASPFHRNKDCDPLYAACRNGRPEVARLLLDRGASAYGAAGPDTVIPHPHGGDHVDFPLWSACYAVANGRRVLTDKEEDEEETAVSPACVRLLLARGVHIDARAGPRGQTLLHVALVALNYGIARVLLMHGADIFCADTSGATPFGHMCDVRQMRRDDYDFFSAPSRRALIALFDRYLPAYWARTVALTLDRLPGSAVAGDENLTRQIGAFVVGDVLLRPRRTAK